MDVLYSDADLLAVNKPPGITTTPDAANPDALIVHLRAQHGELYAVHRLDKNTSGVVLFARTVAAHRALNALFETHAVVKTYQAIINGNPWWSAQTISAPLQDDADNQHRTLVDARIGKPALTMFRVLERFRDSALIEAKLLTGRTHQIRAHLVVLGTHILADGSYAGLVRASKPNIRMLRMALHACALELRHPATGGLLSMSAPYPDDFAECLRALRNVSSG